MSRFSEVLGAAQESTHTSGYPEVWVDKQLDTQHIEHLPEQQTQLSEKSETQIPGYPNIQQPEQSDIEPVEHLSSQQPTSTKNQSSKKPNTQLSGYPDIQQPEQSTTQTAKNLKDKDKLAKRENPDYTQTTFRIPKKLSRQINRVLMDLADEGVEVDRSDFLKELASAFIRLADQVGVVEALEQVKNWGNPNG
ncbi:hypothetical protein [Nostoc sp. CCY0012]|uniref:hypothetical protein n=1 Tax=Nostoc sp. CCY0012 TaxID=1056123 RepID=UPI0039C72A3E